MNKVLIQEIAHDFYLKIRGHYEWQIKFYFEDEDAINEYRLSDERNGINYNFWVGVISISKLNNKYESLVNSNKLNKEDTINFLNILLGYLENTKYIETLIMNHTQKKVDYFDLVEYCSHYKFLDFFQSELERLNTTQTNINQTIIDEFPILSWNTDKGSKTDLAELLYVLAKSQMILKEGKPITHKDLTKVFNKLLSSNIDESKPIDLVGKRNKKETFIDELAKIMYDKNK